MSSPGACRSLWDPVASLLAQLLLPDGLGSIEGSSGDGVELQVLVEGASGLVAVRESLLLVVDGQEVEGRHEQDRDCEWPPGAPDLGGIPPTSERCGENGSTVSVICTCVWISEGRRSVWLVCTETAFLFQELLLLSGLRCLNGVHYIDKLFIIY